MFYWDWTYILVLIGLALGLLAQARVSAAYSKYGKVQTRAGVPAAEAIGRLLFDKGLSQVRVEQTAGTLTDHFDPRSKVLRLSQGVYGSSSVAALGIAAHEAGHALQQKENYPFLMLRTAVVPVVNIGSSLYWIVFVMGIIFSFQPLVTAGIILFCVVLAFSLITLPVEFNASSRAMAMLTDSGYLTESELRGVKTVLNAAAMTYVASFVSTLLQLLRLLLLANRNRRD